MHGQQPRRIGGVELLVDGRKLHVGFPERPETPSGLSVSVGLGSPILLLTIIPSGLSVVIGLGTPSLAPTQDLTPSGLSVIIGLGTPTVATTQNITPTGLSVVIGLGTPTLPKDIPAQVEIVEGSDDTLIAVRGSDDTLIVVSGSEEVLFVRRGSETMARNQDVSVHRGNDFGIEVRMNPVPVGGIAAWAITSSVRQTADAPNLSFPAKTTPVSIIINVTDLKKDPAGNSVAWKFTVVIDDTDTETLTPGNFAWDAKRTDDANEATLVIGDLDILQDVTR